MNAYVETSAFVKLLLVEDGSEEMDAVWDAATLVLTSRLTYVEARAAVAAARRAGRLSSSAMTQSTSELEDRFGALDVVEVSPSLARSAGDLAEEHALRGYDAIHLASALSLGPAEIVLVTWDRDLALAGRTHGLEVAGIAVG